MINVEFRRVNSGYACQPDFWERDWQKALSHLLKYEFGFGGQVVELSQGRLVVKTQVFSCVDTMIYTGSLVEMAPLVEAAQYWLASLEHNDLNIERTVARLSATAGMVGMRAFYVRHLAPLIIGENRLKVILMMSFGLREAADIEAGMALSQDDLAAALSLWRGSDESVPQAQSGAQSGFRDLLAALAV